MNAELDSLLAGFLCGLFVGGLIYMRWLRPKSPGKGTPPAGGGKGGGGGDGTDIP